MVEESDLGLVPAGFKKIYGNGSDRFKETVMEMEAGRLFSEHYLRNVWFYILKSRTDCNSIKYCSQFGSLLYQAVNPY